jgi:hypothetical protein
MIPFVVKYWQQLRQCVHTSLPILYTLAVLICRQAVLLATHQHAVDICVEHLRVWRALNRNV